MKFRSKCLLEIPQRVRQVLFDNRIRSKGFGVSLSLGRYSSTGSDEFGIMIYG